MDKKEPFYFIILLGIISLLGDITYEGARSVTGPYLGFLGASVIYIGMIAGLGEFLGYGLRIFSGYFVDRTKSYWIFTILGYGLILSIPLLAFSKRWEIAGILIILERIGKSIRSPARDTILSYATKEIGRGFGFGIHEALDQIGAVIGPLIFTIVFFAKKDYKYGFNILWIPMILLLLLLFFTRYKFPFPEKFEIESIEKSNKLPKIFYYYAIFIFLSMCGFSNFQLISYHFKFKTVIPLNIIPFLYTVSMGIDGIFALVIGKIYDKIGLKTLLLIPFLNLLIPFFVFSLNYILAISGMVLWGMSMGIQETIMRAGISDIVSTEKRGFAYGLFNAIYGAGLFIGGVIIGFLYQYSIKTLFFVVFMLEIISIFVFIFFNK